MKWCCILLLAAMLSGCGTQEVFETVGDELVLPVMAQPAQVMLTLPPGTAAPVLKSDTQQVYVGESYEILVETLEAGDLDATLRQVSGYGRDQLTLVQTQWADVARYEFVWAAAGEQGDRLGRGVVLDDGQYHYCLTVLRDAANGEDQGVWNELCSSFTLRTG